MFCRKTLYSKIKKIHHRTLKVVYGIDDSYKNLLLSSNSVSIHQRHLRFLVTEIFKSVSQINLEFMWSSFYGTNAIHVRGSLIWNNLPA